MSKKQVTMIKCDRCGSEEEFNGESAAHWNTLIMYPLNQRSKPLPNQVKDLCDDCAEEVRVAVMFDA